MTNTQGTFRAALAALFILHGVMLAALYADVAPHPPLTIPLFAMGPFLGAVLALIAATWISEARGLALVVAALALVSFGPQKYLDPQFALIWPAVLTAQVAVAGLIAESLGALLRRRRGAIQ